MKALNEDDLTEVRPMLNPNTVQVYIYLDVRYYLQNMVESH
jgi:hypothetical protein